VSVRDLRNAGWCWQEKATLDVLCAFYSGDKLKRRATALAIYLVLTEIASDAHNSTHAEATHRAIWERTGTSQTTIKQYLREFIEAGLVAVERQKVHRDINLPNVYVLLTPGAVDSPTPATDGQDRGATDSPTPATNGHHPQEPIKNEETRVKVTPAKLAKFRAADTIGRR
jgi:DNA-binding MarR family transcriptional regulator